MGVRVLHVVESLRPEAGAVAISLRGLFRALRPREVESEVATLDGAGADVAEGVRVTTCTPAGAGRLVESADVVHLHGWGSEFAREVAAAAVKTNTPYVVSPHGMLGNGARQGKGWRARLRGWLGDARLIRRAAAVAALNEQEQRELREQYAGAAITLLPYGLSVGEYETADGDEADPSAGSDKSCLLLLGPIDPVEGFVPLLKAFVGIGPDADGWKVTLAGSAPGDWRSMLEAAVRRKGGMDRVEFTSAQDVATQKGRLAQASVLAAVSLQVRCPVSVLQAVAAGVPVIASRWSLPPGLEPVVHVCSPNREELTEALRRLFGLRDDERRALGRNARNVGRSVFDWPVLVERYVQLYNSLT